MAVTHHQHVNRPAKVSLHRIQEDLLRGFVGRRQGMGQADSQAFDFNHMGATDALVGCQFEAMAIEAFVAVAEGGKHRGDFR